VSPAASFIDRESFNVVVDFLPRPNTFAGCVEVPFSLLKVQSAVGVCPAGFWSLMRYPRTFPLASSLFITSPLPNLWTSGSSDDGVATQPVLSFFSLDGLWSLASPAVRETSMDDCAAFSEPITMPTTPFFLSFIRPPDDLLLGQVFAQTQYASFVTSSLFLSNRLPGGRPVRIQIPLAAWPESLFINLPSSRSMYPVGSETELLPKKELYQTIPSSKWVSCGLTTRKR